MIALFAAGHTSANAAIAVTRGALQNLNRTELQGVIGHEFSHILNGDMRLNIRIMGMLFGLLVIAIVGRTVSWYAPRQSDSNAGKPISNPKNNPSRIIPVLRPMVIGNGS